MLRTLKRLFFGTLLFAAGYVLWVCLVYRDIPVETFLEQQAGSDIRSAEIGGNRIYYRDQGAGPALVLIHSHFFSMSMWDQWADILEDDFRVIRYDLTSHGLTGPEVNHDYSEERDLALLQGLLSELDIDRFSIVGSSLGGNLAFAYAAQHPQSVANLVLVNSGGQLRESSRGRGEDVPDWFDKVIYLFPQTLYKKFLNWMIHDDQVVTDQLVETFHNGFRREGNRTAEAKRIQQFKSSDPSTVLAKVSAPTLILWGEKNPQLPLSHATLFKQQLRNAARVELRSYPQAGHVIPLEIPRQSAADVRAFLLDGSSL